MLMRNPANLKEALDESRRLESNGCTGLLDQSMASIDLCDEFDDFTIGNVDGSDMITHEKDNYENVDDNLMVMTYHQKMLMTMIT